MKDHSENRTENRTNSLSFAANGGFIHGRISFHAYGIF